MCVVCCMALKRRRRKGKSELEQVESKVMEICTRVYVVSTGVRAPANEKNKIRWYIYLCFCAVCEFAVAVCRCRHHH